MEILGVYFEYFMKTKHAAPQQDVATIALQGVWARER